MFLLSDFDGLPETFLNAGKNGEVSVHADVHLQAPAPKHPLQNGNAASGSSRVENLQKALSSVGSVGGFNRSGNRT